MTTRKTIRPLRRYMVALLSSAAAISFAAVAAIGYTLDPEHARPGVDKVLSLIGTGERQAPAIGGESPIVMAMRPAADKPLVSAPAQGVPDLDVMADSRSLQTTSVGAFGMELLENRQVSVFRTADSGQGFGGPGQFQSFSEGSQTTWRTGSFSGPAGGGLSFGGGGGGGAPAQAAANTFASEVNGDWLLFAVNHRALGVDLGLQRHRRTGLFRSGRHHRRIAGRTGQRPDRRPGPGRGSHSRGAAPVRLGACGVWRIRLAQSPARRPGRRYDRRPAGLNGPAGDPRATGPAARGLHAPAHSLIGRLLLAAAGAETVNFKDCRRR
jgi:hypothetical protein